MPTLSELMKRKQDGAMPLFSSCGSVAAARLSMDRVTGWNFLVRSSLSLYVLLPGFGSCN